MSMYSVRLVLLSQHESDEEAFNRVEGKHMLQHQMQCLHKV